MTGHIYRHHEPQLHVHTTGVYRTYGYAGRVPNLRLRHMNIKFMKKSGGYGHRVTFGDGTRHE